MQRRARRWLCWLAIGGCFVSAAAGADTHARVADIHPAVEATLSPNESLYVRIEYNTDEPVKLWARPFHRGREVEQAFSNGSSSYVGSGSALGWFSLGASGDVDEVRVRAGGGKPYREWDVASLPVALQWQGGVPGRAGGRPAWVRQLEADAAARTKADLRRAASVPVSAGDVALFNGFMLTMFAVGIAGIVVPVWSWWKWRGRWRASAAAPVAIVLFVVLRIVVETAFDPTSHNLWPFEILMASGLSLALVGALKFVRRLTGADASEAD